MMKYYLVDCFIC